MADTRRVLGEQALPRMSAAAGESVSDVGAGRVPVSISRQRKVAHAYAVIISGLGLALSVLNVVVQARDASEHDSSVESFVFGGRRQ